MKALTIIPSFPNYSATSCGQIYSNKRKKFLKPSAAERYLTVGLRKDGKTYSKRIHRLVAEAFLGDVQGKVVRHINDNPRDNRAANLAIGTAIDNGRDRIINWAKKNMDVIEYVYTNSDAAWELKQKFDIDEYRIKQIREGVFGYLTDHLPKPSYKRWTISDAQVAEIKLLKSSYDMTLSELALRYEISESAVSRIVNNKRR